MAIRLHQIAALMGGQQHPFSFLLLCNPARELVENSIDLAGFFGIRFENLQSAGAGEKVATEAEEGKVEEDLLVWSQMIPITSDGEDGCYLISKPVIKCFTAAVDAVDGMRATTTKIKVILVTANLSNTTTTKITLEFPLDAMYLREFLSMVDGLPVGIDHQKNPNPKPSDNPMPSKTKKSLVKERLLEKYYIKSSSLLIPTASAGSSPPPPPNTFKRSSSIPTDSNDTTDAKDAKDATPDNPFITSTKEFNSAHDHVKKKYLAKCMIDPFIDQFTKRPSSGVRLLLYTWNVAALDIESQSVVVDLSGISQEVEVVVVGMQEIDDRSEAYIYHDPARLEKWKRVWIDGLEKKWRGEWDYVGGRQLVGILGMVFVRKEGRDRVGGLGTGSLATGLMGVVGNKGAVALRFGIDDSIITCSICHFAADVEMVEKRNSEFTACMEKLTTPLPHEYAQWDKDEGLQEYIWSVPWVYGLCDGDLTVRENRGGGKGVIPLYMTDFLFFMGDLNYRVTVPRSVFMEKLKAGVEGAFSFDQLGRERGEGRVFGGFEEANVAFMPTYKYDVGTSVYDTSEKQRCPAWCDRILWRKQPQKVIENVIYDSIKTQSASDHKPVYAIFNLKTRTLDKEALAAHTLSIMRKLDVYENEATPCITVTPSTLSSSSLDSVSCFTEKVTRLVLKNTGKVWARVACVVEKDGCEWVKLEPAKWFLFPGEQIDIAVRVKIPVSRVASLNRGESKLDTTLVFQVQDGRDVFVGLESHWRPSCFGEAVGVLCRSGDGGFARVRREELRRIDGECKEGKGVGVSVPREIARLVDFIYTHGKNTAGIFEKSGHGFVAEYFRACIDSGMEFDVTALFDEFSNPSSNLHLKDWLDVSIEDMYAKLDNNNILPKDMKKTRGVGYGLDTAVHSCFTVLADLLKSFPNPIIPITAQDRCINEGYLSVIAAKQVVAQTMRKVEINVFMYIMLFLKDFASAYNGGGGAGGRDKQKTDVESWCKVFAPLLFQSAANATATASGGVNTSYFSYFSGGGADYMRVGDMNRRVQFLQRFLE